MRFEIVHRFEASPDEVAEVLLDEDYQRSLEDLSQQLKTRVLLSQERENDGTVLRRIRSVVGVDLGPAKRFIGEREPAWVEHARWDPDAMRWEWKIEPEVASHLLDARGEMRLEPDGAATRRRITGEIKVPIPLYGRRVEEVVVDHLRQGYNDEAGRLQQWLRERPGGVTRV